jgi:HSP20 family molecular chaperone IbpA
MTAMRKLHSPLNEIATARMNTVRARATQSGARGDARNRSPLPRLAGILAGSAAKPHIWRDRPERESAGWSRGRRKGPVKVAYEGFEAMSRVPSLSSPFLLGFDEIERALDRVAKAADGYPPYNIERIARQNGQPERLRITLAVAGFRRDQLDVTVEESQLVIRGRQQDDKEHHYLHRGIAARQFQRTFVLADGMEVLGADLKNGLLSIDLARPEPERIVKTISITDHD